MIPIDSIKPDLKKESDVVDSEFMWDIFGKVWEDTLKEDSIPKKLEIWRIAIVVFLVGIISYGPVSKLGSDFLGPFSTIIKLIIIGVAIWILFYGPLMS